MTRDNAEIICWVKTQNDTRDTASSTATASVPQSVVVKLARNIDDYGNSGAGEYLPRFQIKTGSRLAVGHGVSVRYKSGYVRHIRST